MLLLTWKLKHLIWTREYKFLICKIAQVIFRCFNLYTLIREDTIQPINGADSG